ncbi:activating molecule in BECN1-regulated autophagy protein 1A-like [Anopheles moucheti]|uniref:activating molecule in BECN1-regulated autophagy protein 1A-like n=1 Tax=Anopheles moucheti TaxID=186751 RepID=UPI0022F13CA9|nr:activating molecule in BECN1-regulated autophagy protein 1A-like [Anopheles moucheti]
MMVQPTTFTLPLPHSPIVVISDEKMLKIDRNIVYQLDNRERGYRTRRIRRNASMMSATTTIISGACGEPVFRQLAVELAELALMERLKTTDLCEPIDDLASETESVFNIEQSHNGLLTATVQTNRSVNVFKTSSMQKVAKYPTGDRSVWTLAFHPTNENIIAFGTLGGAVSVYVDNCLAGTLNEPEPIGSLCFHPTLNFLLLTSMNEVIFWDWVNNKTYTTGMYSDCKCRFLHVTQDLRLITGITQTKTHLMAGVGKNVEEVEPEYLMVSFLRSVSLMLDKLELTLSTQVEYLLQLEMNKQCLIWIHLLQTINRKRGQVRCSSTVSPADKCTKSNLNLTLMSLIRKIDALEDRLLTRNTHNTSICITTEISQRLWSPGAVLLTQPLIYFRNICQNYICQGHRSYIKYIFDLSLVSELLRKVCHMLYTLAPSELPDTWDYISQLYGRPLSPEKHCILQAWDLESFQGDVDDLPDFKEDWKNVITICLINNDSNVAISQCEQFIASVRFRSVNEMEIRSLRRDNFGELIYAFKFTASFVSLSFSPSGRYVAVGLRCRRNLKYAYILDKETRWRIGVGCNVSNDSNDVSETESVSQNDRVGIRLCLPLDPDNYLEINCIKWASLPGYGLLLGLKSNFIQVCR